MADKSDNQPDMNQGRSKEFAKSENLENLLSEVNGAIAPILPPYRRPKHPIILVMGAPRSGTTLTSQWLADTGLFAYPTNLSARFFANPYMGARIQQILADYDTGNQIGLNQPLEYTSALGKTTGALAPSEFWYFWRQFFKFGDLQQLTDEALAEVDSNGFMSGLAGLESAFDKPLMLKGMIMNWHVPFLDSLFDRVLFLNLEREPFFNAQSLYFARDRFFGDVSRWYSFKPAEYVWLRHESVPRQIAGQVAFTRSALRAGLSGVAESRKLHLSYEALCTDPAKAYAAICEKLTAQDYHLPQHYAGPGSFEVTNRVKMDRDAANQIEKALADFDNSNAIPSATQE